MVSERKHNSYISEVSHSFVFLTISRFSDPDVRELEEAFRGPWPAQKSQELLTRADFAMRRWKTSWSSSHALWKGKAWAVCLVPAGPGPGIGHCPSWYDSSFTLSVLGLKLSSCALSSSLVHVLYLKYKNEVLLMFIIASIGLIQWKVKSTEYVVVVPFLRIHRQLVTMNTWSEYRIGIDSYCQRAARACTLSGSPDKVGTQYGQQ